VKTEDEEVRFIFYIWLLKLIQLEFHIHITEKRARRLLRMAEGRSLIECPGQEFGWLKILAITKI
jgi:hypothetical protein